MNKLSIVIPVYYNEKNLVPLYEDIKEKFISKIDFSYEIIMVDDGSKDGSWDVMKKLASIDEHIRIFKLSRNFGSHAAIFCGLVHSTGDCAVVKAADLQEPTELLLQMYDSWKDGNNVVLAVRKGRDEGKSKIAFANFYYWLVKTCALPTMPKSGFDIYLIDRKVIDVLRSMNEGNSALTGQILWCGFKTGIVQYSRKKREIGKSRWTLKKKLKLVFDTLFSFSTLPTKLVSIVGAASICISFIWTIIVIVYKLSGAIQVSGFSTIIIFNLFSFGIIMLTLGILSGYIWRTFDASRGRPVYIVEDNNENYASRSDEFETESRLQAAASKDDHQD